MSAQERVYRVCFHYHGRRRHRHPPCPASTDVLRARVRVFRIVVVGHDDPRGRHVHSSRRRGRPPYYFIVILYTIRDHPNFFALYLKIFFPPPPSAIYTIVDLGTPRRRTYNRLSVVMCDVCDSRMMKGGAFGV